MENFNKLVLEALLPGGVLNWFEVKGCQVETNDVRIILEENNNPPIPEKFKDRNIISKGFKDITITDFPIRGKRTLITFRRRYWKVEGQENYLKRDIQLVFPGTQLEKEFALFLKEDGGRQSGLAHFYRQVSLPPTERI
jgi:hypothetical protein